MVTLKYFKDFQALQHYSNVTSYAWIVASFDFLADLTASKDEINIYIYTVED